MTRLKVFLSAAFFCLTSNVFAFFDVDDEFYVGINVQQVHLKWLPDLGGNLLPKSAPQVNPFAGFKLSDQIGLELGFRYAKSTERYAHFKSGQVLLDREIVSETERHQGQFLLSGWHADLVFLTNYFWDDWQGFASLGVDLVKAEVKNTHLSSKLIALLPETEINQKNRLKSTLSPVLRLGGGLQYALSEQISIRTQVLLENTARVGALKDFTQESQAKLKNSCIYSIGLVFHL